MHSPQPLDRAPNHSQSVRGRENRDWNSDEVPSPLPAQTTDTQPPEHLTGSPKGPQDPPYSDSDPQSEKPTASEIHSIPVNADSGASPYSSHTERTMIRIPKKKTYPGSAKKKRKKSELHLASKQ